MSDSSSDDEKNKAFMDEIKSWKVEKLKEFLQARSIPLGQNPARAKLLKNVLYASVQLPHPNEIGNWVIHKEIVIKLLPTTTYSDIETYAFDTHSSKALKEGHFLYSSDHITSVSFNNLSDAVKFCYLKGTIVPQTRINNEEYESWVCLNKNGSILSAECKCIAGYGESCKHIFALLLFVEEHVRLGENVTCTSVKQKWGIRTQISKLHEPDILQNISIKKVKPSIENKCLKLS
ncbi:uncharacterized protein LOC136089769 [Hydra vulgaris]|uniref:Uncharacterized protein LOC136089763 n=1 Tax=Hydra vulgaris TaxID=6087 RepID=A0ABM4DC44_HYDVU